MIIYKVTNLINNKVYIGQTIKTLEQRKNNHIKSANKENGFYFHKSLKKYGEENFKWQVICICPNIESLNEQEEYYITHYNSMNEGYNLTSGGENYTRSEKTKRKISIAALKQANITKQKVKETLGHNKIEPMKFKPFKMKLL